MFIVLGWHMTDNEKKLKDALDDIFGSDFIDIDSSNNNDIVNEEKSDLNLEFNDMIESISDSLKVEEEKEKQEVVQNPKEEYVDDHVIKDNYVDYNDENNYIDSSINNEYDKKKEYDAIDNDISDSDKVVNKKKSHVPIIILLLIVLAAIIVMVIMFINNNKEIKEYCYYSAKDTGYKTSDSYTITYKKGMVTYVEGTYEYIALKDEYKNEIEAIKEEKIPVIINSNGINGFTHIYEVSDTSIKINSYYDILLFDSNVVDKNDNKLNPLSYIDLKSNTSISDLKKSLIKKGYTCSLSR